MKQFYWRIAICLVPVLISVFVVSVAGFHYETGSAGMTFRAGVDLVGGTILVYEVDVDKFPDGKMPENYKPEELAAAIKRRISTNSLRMTGSVFAVSTNARRCSIIGSNSGSTR